MAKRHFEYGYRGHLLDLVHSYKHSENIYLLLIHLHNKEFYAYNDGDQAREEDGLNLREAYEHYSDQILSSGEAITGERISPNPGRIPNGPCTFLEFLIGMALRMDYFCTPPESQPQTHYYFWRLIKNLDLYDDPLDVPAIDEKIDRFLSRAYKENGEGGLFPLRHPSEDQRDVSIWYQMSAYINEHPKLYQELIREDEDM